MKPLSTVASLFSVVLFIVITLSCGSVQHPAMPSTATDIHPWPSFPDVRINAAEDVVAVRDTLHDYNTAAARGDAAAVTALYARSNSEEGKRLHHSLSLYYDAKRQLDDACLRHFGKPSSLPTLAPEFPLKEEVTVIGDVAWIGPLTFLRTDGRWYLSANCLLDPLARSVHQFSAGLIVMATRATRLTRLVDTGVIPDLSTVSMSDDLRSPTQTEPESVFWKEPDSALRHQVPRALAKHFTPLAPLDNLQQYARPVPPVPRLMFQSGLRNPCIAARLAVKARAAVTVDGGGCVEVWSIPHARLIRQLRYGDTAAPRGPRVVSGREYGFHNIERVTTSEPVLSVSDDLSLIALSASDGTHIWNGRTGTLVARRASTLAAVDSEGRVIVEYNDGKRALQALRINGWGQHWRSETLDAQVTALNISRTLVTAGLADGSVTAWRVDDGTLVGRWKCDTPIINISCECNERYIVATRIGGMSATVLSLTPGTPPVEVQTQDSPAIIRLSNDGTRAICSGYPALVKQVSSGVTDRSFPRSATPFQVVSIAEKEVGILGGVIPQSYGGPAGAAWLWDCDQARPVATFGREVPRITSIDLDRSGQRIGMTLENGSVQVFDASTMSVQLLTAGHWVEATSVRFLTQNTVVSGGLDGAIHVHSLTGGSDRVDLAWGVAHWGVADLQYDAATHSLYVASASDATIQRIDVERDATMWNTYAGGGEVFTSLSLTRDGVLLASSTNIKAHVNLLEAKTGQLVRRFVSPRFGPVGDGKHFDRSEMRRVFFACDDTVVGSTSDRAGTVLWNLGTGQVLLETEEVMVPVSGMPGVLARVSNGSLRLWDPCDAGLSEQYDDVPKSVSQVAAVPVGGLLCVLDSDGLLRVWRRTHRKPVGDFVSTSAGHWAVASADGRFDTNDLDEVRGLHWVFPDDPFRALPPEIYLRDYYEPKLLAKLLRGEKLPEVRPLQKLNRAQPQVRAVRVGPGSSAETVTVEVDVEGGTYSFQDGSRTDATDAYDLRLLRDGQLVGRYPPVKDTTPDGVADAEVAQWQADTEVDKTTVTFPDVKLPHRSADRAVEFTAYAFNKDRVKGPTSTPAAYAPLQGQPTKKAYILCIGVNDYGSPAWDLDYAAKDAEKLASTLGPYLKGYTPVVHPLISDQAKDEAGKDAIRKAVEELASNATPDDLVLMFFAGHGFGTSSGTFYLLPSDSRPWAERDWKTPSPETLVRCISAEELSHWMRSIDADEMVLVIDACQSAAAVDTPGFKPGPLGNRGLGQLAYDKRMRVLAASQTDQEAREAGGAIGHGVLTYALVQEGLLKDLPHSGADTDGDGKLTLKEWLAYPVSRVPTLLEEIHPRLPDTPTNHGAESAVTILAPNTQNKASPQLPELFDFAGRRETIIERP